MVWGDCAGKKAGGRKSGLLVGNEEEKFVDGEVEDGGFLYLFLQVVMDDPHSEVDDEMTWWLSSQVRLRLRLPSILQRSVDSGSCWGTEEGRNR